VCGKNADRSANELRQNFGVVPQQTVLFSGSEYDNLIMAYTHATYGRPAQGQGGHAVHHARAAEKSAG
jgi:subfamily B ATP-binding cassette protein HlyB/CyaB